MNNLMLQLSCHVTNIGTNKHILGGSKESHHMHVSVGGDLDFKSI
jgi:hypothetical protein